MWVVGWLPPVQHTADAGLNYLPSGGVSGLSGPTRDDVMM